MPADSSHDLYGLALDQFTPERDALAKRLRSDGAREEAERVKKLRKPTAAAWAVNQLVRTQRKEIEALFRAGDETMAAQGQGDADRLRRSAAERRDALAVLMSRAEGLLGADGRSLAAGVLEKVSETLRAAAIDPEAREQLQDGCLTRELQVSGFPGGASSGTSAPAKKPVADEKAKRKAELKAARDRAGKAEKSVRRARAQLEAAEEGLVEAENVLKSAQGGLAEAERDLQEAQSDVERLQRGGK